VVSLLNPPKPALYKVEHWYDIEPPPGEEWLVKGLLPQQGVGTFFGSSGSYKSFSAIDIAWHIAAGTRWAGRKVKRAPVVYLAAEGSAGVRKRLSGARKMHGLNKAREPLYVIGAALNLGTGSEDADKMIASIEATGVKPGCVTIDTLSATLAGGDENGQGIGMFLSNCQRIAMHFGCFVLAVHHVGYGENAGQRERGHSSLPSNVDTRILCERPEDNQASLTFLKVKDGPDNMRFRLRLEVVDFGSDRDGDASG
jgi:RecA-family ATPase